MLRLVQRLNVVPLSHVASALADDVNRGRLVEAALLTPLVGLQTFLVNAKKTEELVPVFEALIAELGKDEHRKGLVERVCLMHPTAFPRFLNYAAKTEGLRPLRKALVVELCKDENRNLIVDQAWRWDLGALEFYMAYVNTIDKLRPVFETLCIQLANHQERMVERALLTPLRGIQSFLAYAEQTAELRPVFEALVADLGKSNHSRQLAERIEVEPIEDLSHVLSAENARDFWKLVLLDVDEEEWRRNRLRGREVTPDSFVVFQRCAAAVGRPELAAAPALNLVRKSKPNQWHRSGIGLHHLSHVLRCATNATDEEIRHFLEQIATDDWIDYQVVTGASTGGLAGSLLALSTTLPVDLRKLFLRPSLRERVTKEVSTARPKDFEVMSQTLSLLGAAAALGLQLDSVEADWPRGEDLTAILELRTPSSEWATIGHLEVQLWLGLREMVRLRHDVVSVPSEYGDAILSLWHATHDGETGQSQPSHVFAASARMITWLECCRANGWRLIKDGA